VLPVVFFAGAFFEVVFSMGHMFFYMHAISCHISLVLKQKWQLSIHQNIEEVILNSSKNYPRLLHCFWRHLITSAD
jgi:hypothetical protein